MSKPLMLSIGGVPDTPQNTHSDASVPTSLSPVADNTATYPGEPLIEIYETLKRHEETLRDLIVEVRLLYHNLPDKERKRLEERRERTTREVGDSFTARIRSLDETILRLRGSR